MVRPRTEDRQPKREQGYGNVRVTAEVLNLVRVIAAHRGLDLSQVFDRFAKAALVAEYRAVVREMDAELHKPDLGGEG